MNARGTAPGDLGDREGQPAALAFSSNGGDAAFGYINVNA
jgi:hypothetical protein